MSLDDTKTASAPTTKHVIAQFYPTSFTRRRMGAPITYVPSADRQSVRAAN
jgi:hypothetical protein